MAEKQVSNCRCSSELLHLFSALGGMGGRRASRPKGDDCQRRGLGPPCLATQFSDRWSWATGTLAPLTISGRALGVQGAP